MKITENKREMLNTARLYCDENDKSTEFMISYMSDYAGVSHDKVMEYLMSL